jgi:hypothetical protein
MKKNADLNKHSFYYSVEKMTAQVMSSTRNVKDAYELTKGSMWAETKALASGDCQN